MDIKAKQGNIICRGHFMRKIIQTAFDTEIKEWNVTLLNEQTPDRSLISEQLLSIITGTLST